MLLIVAAGLTVAGWRIRVFLPGPLVRTSVTREPEFDDVEADWFRALAEHEAEKRANQCPLCGLDKSICRNIDLDGRVPVTAERCHVMAAISRRQHAAEQAGMDHLGSIDFSATPPQLDPNG